jgi:geranylgeranyl diphosphate synthase, type II
MPFTPGLEAYRKQVESSLESLFETCEGPAHLIEAMGYSLFAGGKRLRPVLLMATHDLFSKNGLDPMPAACALEFIHTYSLIHDDLPAMDNDDFRRGRPTNHKRFGEAQAILAGDGLLTEAFGLMARHYGDSADSSVIHGIAEVALAAGSAGMVGGQVLDMTETGHDLDQEQLETVHRLKTGALIRAAVRCGAILGHANADELDRLTQYAEAIGLAFQVADDLLDVLGSREELGKSTGKDQAQGKTTYAGLLGIQDGRNYVADLTSRAIANLEVFGEKAESLRDIARFIADSVGPQNN